MRTWDTKMIQSEFTNLKKYSGVPLSYYRYRDRLVYLNLKSTERESVQMPNRVRGPGNGTSVFFQKFYKTEHKPSDAL